MTGDNTKFDNSSYYIIPAKVCGDANSLAIDHFDWKEQEVPPMNYLAGYVDYISKNSELCRCYSYCGAEKLSFVNSEVKVDNISLWVFGTGIAFVEMLVSYGKLPIEEIIDMAYVIKRTSKHGVLTKGTLLGYFESIVPSEVKLFFSMGENVLPFRKTCICMHMIFQRKEDEYDYRKALYYLKRSYSTGFAYDIENETGKYDLEYHPHNYLQWAFSQEAIVCLCSETETESTNKFLHGLMYSSHLKIEYHFLYLLLLCNRFTALDIVDEIVRSDNNIKIIKRIGERSICLKTKYCFKVVSDDMIFQNVYSKISRILEIDDLLQDIEENGENLDLLAKEETIQKEKKMQTILTGLSILVIFSALIDFASYIQLFSVSARTSGLISAFVIIGTVF